MRFWLPIFVMLICGELALLAAQPVKNQGAISSNEILQVMQSNMGEIRGCYETQLMQGPVLAGKIGVQYIIALSGKVRKCKVTSDSTGSSALKSCVCKVIMTWKFPKPPGKDEVTVAYPFAFGPVEAVEPDEK